MRLNVLWLCGPKERCPAVHRGAEHGEAAAGDGELPGGVQHQQEAHELCPLQVHEQSTSHISLKNLA